MYVNMRPIICYFYFKYLMVDKISPTPKKVCGFVTMIPVLYKGALEKGTTI